MKFSTETLKKLRRLTNTVSQANCIQVLTQTHGDLEQAHALLVFPRFRDSAPVISPDTPPMWAYLVTKAAMYTKMGPAIYRSQDAFAMPPADWDEPILQEIGVCFAQFLRGLGYHATQPTRVSVSGFHAAMATLHFELVQQFATNAGADILDCMIFAHQVDQRTIELFNRSLD